MRYVDLMGGQKPHLLTCSRNNLGAETRVQYAPSTKFYLADSEAGTPVGHAPAVPRARRRARRNVRPDQPQPLRDALRYHHGYFDGVEREFRGFGMVEQRDTEELGALEPTGAFPASTNIDAASYVPPVSHQDLVSHGRLPAWRARLEASMRASTTGNPELSDEQLGAMQLPDTVLPADLADGRNPRGDPVLSRARSCERRCTRSTARRPPSGLTASRSRTTRCGASSRLATIDTRCSSRMRASRSIFTTSEHCTTSAW